MEEFNAQVWSRFEGRIDGVGIGGNVGRESQCVFYQRLVLQHNLTRYHRMVPLKTEHLRSELKCLCSHNLAE